MMYQDVALAYTCVHASIASQAEFSTPMCEEHLVGIWQERAIGWNACKLLLLLL